MSGRGLPKSEVADIIQKWPLDEMGQLVPPDDAVMLSVPSGRRVVEYAAVLESAGLQVARRQLGPGHAWVVIVDKADAAVAVAQLESFEREQLNWPPKEVDPLPQIKPGRASMAVGIGLLAIFFGFGAGDSTTATYQNGAADAALIFEGEWYRCITALSLHADFAHVMANVAFGVLLGAMLSRRFGGGWSWLLILIAGAIGNAINSGWMGPEHRSIGASTGVFAAIGLLTGVRVRRLLAGMDSMKTVWIPLLAACAFYFFVGNDPESDTSAHVSGLLSGLCMGVLLPKRLPIERWGVVAGGIALSIFALAWALAAKAGG